MLAAAGRSAPKTALWSGYRNEVFSLFMVAAGGAGDWPAKARAGIRRGSNRTAKTLISSLAIEGVGGYFPVAVG